MPPTGQEDMTQTLTNRAKSPMNMEIHKTAETECRNRCIELETCMHEHLSCTDAIIQHTQLQLCILQSRINMHSFKHLLNMFIISLIVDMVA